MKKVILCMMILMAFISLIGKSYKVDKYVIDYLLMPNNQIMVKESAFFNFQKGSFSWVSRELSSKRVDQLKIIYAEIDQQDVPFGVGPQRAQVDNNQIKWNFHKTSKTIKQFGVQYLIKGAVYQEDEMDIFEYTLFPRKHQYTVDSLIIRIDFSAFPAQLMGHQVFNGDYDVTVKDQILTIKNRSIVKRDKAPAVRLEFKEKSLISENPMWYQYKERAFKLMMLYLLIALIIIGLGLFFSIRIFLRLNQRFKPEKKDLNRLSELPDELNPVESAYLLYQSIPEYSYYHFIPSIILQLLKKKYLLLNNVKEGKHPQYSFTPQSSQEPLSFYEQLIYDLIFSKKKTKDQCEMKDAINRASLKIDKMIKHIREELINQEILSDQILHYKKKYTMNGFLLILLSLLAILPLYFFFSLLSMSFLLVNLALLFAGIFVIVGAQSATALSIKGLSLTQNVYYFKKHIEDLLKKDYSEHTHQYFLDHLVEIFAFNFQSKWLKKAKDSQFAVPEWLKTNEVIENSDQWLFFYLFMNTMVVHSNSTISVSSGGSSSSFGGGGSSSAG